MWSLKRAIISRVKHMSIGLFILVEALQAGVLRSAYAQHSPPSVVPAEEIVRQCMSAFEQGQIAERRGKLRLSREHLAVCLRAECPTAVRTECAPLFEEVSHRIPTVLPSCRDTSIRITSRGELRIDGQETAFLGTGIEVDPGSREFVVLGTHGRSTEKVSLSIVESKRTQIVEFPCADATPRQSLLMPGIFVGVSALAAASFAGFGIDGLHRRGNLSACRGHCDDELVSKVERSYLGANISLGVSILSLGIAAVLYFSGGAKAKPHAGGAGVHF
jgi:hypothetical protein